MTCGNSGSRLWESNPRPTHYEGRPHRPSPCYLRLCCSSSRMSAPQPPPWTEVASQPVSRRRVAIRLRPLDSGASVATVDTRIIAVAPSSRDSRVTTWRRRRYDGSADALYDLAILTVGHEERLGDVIAGYGTSVDLDVIRAWWPLRSLLAVRWLLTNAQMDSHSPFARDSSDGPPCGGGASSATWAALDRRVALRYAIIGVNDTETASSIGHHPQARRTADMGCSLATTRPGPKGRPVTVTREHGARRRRHQTFERRVPAGTTRGDLPHDRCDVGVAMTSTLHVATTGSDAADGSADRPFRTINRAAGSPRQETPSSCTPASTGSG